MDLHTQDFVIRLVVAAGIVIACCCAYVYVWWGMCVARRGGKVLTEKFGLIDLHTGGLLFAFFAYLSYLGFTRPAAKVHENEVVAGLCMDAMLIGMVVIYLMLRRINLWKQFGFNSMGFVKAYAFGAMFLFAAYPMLLCLNFAVYSILGPEAQQQEVVKYLQDVSKNADYHVILPMLFMGVIMAPVAEELVFRGFLYGIMKRHFGIFASVVLNAALFAAIHVNVASLPSLFLLAVCFTIAYEYTGSLLVNICMHAIFNSITFAFVLLHSSAVP